MAPSFERIADRYDETRGGDDRGSALAVAIQPWLSPGLILEVGVGTGVIADALARTVVGVDISPSMAAKAYKRIGSRVVVGDAFALPIATASVGSVLFVMTLHAIGDIEAAIGEATRVVRPDGHIVAVHGAPGDDAPEIAEALGALSALRTSKMDTRAALAAAARQHGLDLVHDGLTDRMTRLRRPSDFADEIEQRVWSFLWPLDDNAWRRDAMPAIAALRALPEPDRPRPYAEQFSLTVFSRP